LNFLTKISGKSQAGAPVVFIVSLYITKALFFIYKIIIARMIGPAGYGIYSIILLFLLYAEYLHLGVANALVKQVSFFRGQGNTTEAAEIKKSAFSLMMILALTGTAIIIPIVYFIIRPEDRLPAIFYFLAPVLILEQVWHYIVACFFADKKFTAFSETGVVSMLVSGVVILPLIARFSFVGLLSGLFLMAVFTLLYAYIRFRPLLAFKFDLARYASLLKIGFPIILIFFIFAFFFTVDKLFIFRFLGKKSLGYYGIASGLSDLLILFPLALGTWLFPGLSETYGRTGEAAHLKNSVYKSTIIISYLMSFIMVGVYLFFPFGVRMVLPQYIPGIAAARIALIGVLFLAVSIPAKNFLIATNRQMKCLPIIFSALILKSALSYYFINRQMGIEGVAIASSAVYFGYSIVIVAYAFLCYEKGFLKLLKYLGSVYLPQLVLFSLMLAALFFV